MYGGGVCGWNQVAQPGLILEYVDKPPGVTSLSSPQQSCNCRHVSDTPIEVLQHSLETFVGEKEKFGAQDGEHRWVMHVTNELSVTQVWARMLVFDGLPPLHMTLCDNYYMLQTLGIMPSERSARYYVYLLTHLSVDTSIC